jgi:hypothetical protein
MTRKIFADECGRRALGIVPLAPAARSVTGSATKTAAQLPVREAGRLLEAARVEAPAWAIAWVDVTAEAASRQTDPIAAVAAAYQRGAGARIAR